MAFSMGRLSELNAVSGFEIDAIRYIIPLIEDKCHSFEVDSMGNIVAFKKGKSDKYKILIGTNIDEVGFIVSEITDTGFVKFKAVGEIDPRTLVSKTVTIGKSKVPGVIGMKAIHLQKKEEREAAVKVKDLYIDIGAMSKEEAEKYVSLGDMIAFNTKFGETNDIIKGKALDRFGVIPVALAMSETAEYDTYFVFSAQREVPCSVMGRGMKIASYRINPDFAFIVDTVNSEDFPDRKSASAILGEGGVIEYMDRASIADNLFIDEIKALAKRNNIKIQHKTSSRGASIAGAAAVASEGAVIATVGIPCRYAHTPVCMMNKNDIDDVTALTKAFVRESDVIIDGFIKKTNRD